MRRPAEGEEPERLGSSAQQRDGPVQTASPVLQTQDQVLLRVWTQEMRFYVSDVEASLAPGPRSWPLVPGP